MSTLQLKIMNHATIATVRPEDAATPSGECPLCGRGKSISFLRAPDRYHQRTETYELKRCQSCSGVWLASPPAADKMSAHYGADYYRGIATAGEGSGRWRKQRAVVGQHKHGGNILDIGCGSGGFLRTFKNEGKWTLHGIELDPAMAERARSNTGGQVFVGDALSAPFAPESFDVITCFDVLEHVYDPIGLLQKVLYWLKPGGMFYTMLPNIESWEFRMFGSYWYGLELPRHLFHFSPRSLGRAMQAVGFDKGSVRTQRGSYLQLSTRYLYNEGLGKLGLSVRPLTTTEKPAISWRIVRKLLRLFIVAPFGQLAAISGAGACMEAVFLKPSLRGQ